MRFDDFLTCLKQDVMLAKKAEYVELKDISACGRPLIRVTIDDGADMKHALVDIGYTADGYGKYSRYANIYTQHGTSVITERSQMIVFIAHHLGQFFPTPKMNACARAIT